VRAFRLAVVSIANIRGRLPAAMRLGYYLGRPQDGEAP
jgi:hypothetical protein